jgi:16S rRNA (guanine527-N7)-methyltransferase
MSKIELLPEYLDLWESSLHWCPSRSIVDLFQQLYAETITVNRTFNLTRITEPTEFWEKHLWDSLRGISNLLTEPQQIEAIDIGTGGGFPGLPIAIARPDWQLNLVDATAKKINFVTATVEQLNLTNVRAETARIESLGENDSHRDRYDLATIRAVANPNVCAEYALPLLKIGGSAVLYRGNWTEEEQISLDRAVALLGAEITKVDAFTTPLTNGERHCIWVKKQIATPPEFPRGIGIARQKPL